MLHFGSENGLTAWLNGKPVYEFKGKAPYSEVKDNTTYGVLKFTLRAADYTWDYVPAAGEQFHDSGTAACSP